eukprot:COSAG01_NODE_5600_length_4154_cov_46.611344_6_plen_182_part_00
MDVLSRCARVNCCSRSGGKRRLIFNLRGARSGAEDVIAAQDRFARFQEVVVTEGITLPGCVSPRALTPNQGTSSYRRTCAQVDLQHAGGAALLPLRAPCVATKPHLPLADGAIAQHHIAHAHVRGASRPRVGERFGVGGRVGTVPAVRPCSGRRGALTHFRFSWPGQARHTAAETQSRRAA